VCGASARAGGGRRAASSAAWRCRTATEPADVEVGHPAGDGIRLAPAARFPPGAAAWTCRSRSKSV